MAGGASKPKPGQKRTVAAVMHAFKEGELHSSSGAVVESPKQAIAIALHEAGVARDQAPDETRAALLRRAREKGIKGRSRMSKAQLARALA